MNDKTYNEQVILENLNTIAVNFRKEGKSQEYMQVENAIRLIDNLQTSLSTLYQNTRKEQKLLNRINRLQIALLPFAEPRIGSHQYEEFEINNAYEIYNEQIED